MAQLISEMLSQTDSPDFEDIARKVSTELIWKRRRELFGKNIHDKESLILKKAIKDFEDYYAEALEKIADQQADIDSLKQQIKLQKAS